MTTSTDATRVRTLREILREGFLLAISSEVPEALTALGSDVLPAYREYVGRPAGSLELVISLKTLLTSWAPHVARERLLEDVNLCLETLFLNEEIANPEAFLQQVLHTPWDLDDRYHRKRYRPLWRLRGLLRFCDNPSVAGSTKFKTALLALGLNDFLIEEGRYSWTTRRTVSLEPFWFRASVVRRLVERFVPGCLHRVDRPETLRPFRAFLTKFLEWVLAYNLSESWLADAALETLETWSVQKPVSFDRWTMSSDSMKPRVRGLCLGLFNESDLPHEARRWEWDHVWNPLVDTEANFRSQARARFDDWLDLHLSAVKSLLAEEQRLYPSSGGKPMRNTRADELHLKYLALYHVKGLSCGKIADMLARDGVGAITNDTVRKGAQQMATRLGLILRQGSRGPRRASARK